MSNSRSRIFLGPYVFWQNWVFINFIDSVYSLKNEGLLHDAIIYAYT